MPANHGLVDAELGRIVDAAGETPHNDAKRAMTWDNHVESAGLAKDILALANTRDGGAIVIGKREDSGKFFLDGLTPDQKASFDTTKVAQWVNARCAPPVTLTVYHFDRDGTSLVVITVAEFGDIPVICTKDFNDPKTSKPILREGAIYVRTANTASEPLRRSEDVRALIGLATRKQADQLIASFEAVMKGRPLIPPPQVEDPYQAELADIKADLVADLGSALGVGEWYFSFRPTIHVEGRWANLEQLREAVERHTVQLRGRFPPRLEFGKPAYRR